MKLYHGSNVVIEEVDFTKSKPGKDFGVGFYLSADEQQALEMAEKKALLMGGEPMITCFEFDVDAALSDPDIAYLRFENYCLEWGQFVKKNRDNKGYESLHAYDIVYGPITNDNIGLQLRRLNADIIDIDKFVDEIKRKGGETYQYFFGTEKALKYLRKL